MATIKIDFFSQSLMRTVTINAIVPVDKRDKQGRRIAKKEYQTLYLLHGILGNYTDWLSGTRIERWAQEKDLVVIMPSGENHFYVDNENSLQFHSQFIGEELVEVTRAMFPLSHKKEDTFIAGLSMGGYGAITNGLKYYDTFGYIAGLSSALLIDDFVNAKYDSEYLMNRHYLESVFGDLNQLPGSDKDYRTLALKVNKQDMPHIYMACGKDDFLLQQNRDFRDFLIKNDIEVTYIEDEGAHEWDFWDRHIHLVLEWLPLHQCHTSIHSGNVK